MKKLISSFMVLLLVAAFSVSARAAIGDLFVQVDFDDMQEPPEDVGCSIMKVTPDGVISQFISNAQILAVTGDPDADCSDTGLAIGLDGTVFFNEDGDDDILMATNPGGVLSIFVPESALAAAIGRPNADIDNGMAISPVNGNLYVAEEDSDSILMIAVGGFNNGAVSQIITKSQFEALIPPGGVVDLEGGIAIDFAGNLYIANDDSNNDVANVIFKYTPDGVLSILSTQAQLAAATGSTDIDLDVGAVFGGVLWVLDDGDCDCLLRVDPVTGQTVVFVSEAAITSVTGNGNADVEGGLAIDEDQNLYIGDDGGTEVDNNRPSIVKASQVGQNSLFVSTTEIRDFYDVVEPGIDPRLRGSMAIEGIFDFPPTLVPTMSEWGMIATVLGLGIIGFIAVRRRMVKA